MRIFIAATSLHPSYGGPAYSVAGLAAALARAGTQVGLWAADQSADPASFAGPANLQLLSGGAAGALRGFDCDLLHDNGLWMAHNHRLAVLAARRRIPRVVSTRGMLEPWALRHKRLKKSLAWRLYQRRDLRRAQLLHATAEGEAAHLAALQLGVPVCTIPNGVDVPDLRRHEPTTGGEARTALFLGRIYPVKGLPLLIEAWSQMRPPGWRLEIAGPDEAGHRGEVERAVARAGLDDVVSFSGPLEGQAKHDAYARAALFVLPSHSESFGMAAAEALAHGVPVLTTTGTPWRGLAERGCGWSVAPSADAIAQGLRLATAQPPEALRVMGAQGRAWVAAEFSWEKVAADFLAAYERLLRQPALLR